MKEMLENKKGQLENLQGIVLTVVIIGIAIGVLFLILSSFRETMATTENDVTNEQVIPTDAGVYLAYNYTTTGIHCYHDLSVTSVKNATGNIVLTSGNYSYNPYTGLFWNLSSNSLYRDLWNVSYTYKSGKDSCEGVESTIDAGKAIPNFLPVIIIVAIVGILLAIVFGFVLPKAAGSKGETAQI